jgi:peptide/nickel transport system permease protein
MMQAALSTVGAPRGESAGLWTLAWRRFCRDRVGLASFLIVVLFFGVMLASGLHLIARDWSEEVGVNYAPPTFMGTAIPDRAASGAADSSGGEGTRESNPADVRSEIGRPGGAGDIDIADPLADVLAEIRAEFSGASAAETGKAPTLVFGGDRWGRDVLKKAIKGTETSMFVGLAAAVLAALLATVFGALAGYYGGWIDDFFNWFYSVFTSIPYLLLILAIAAVLNQKGTLTVILILGVTGWTGIFRLVRAEYLKHKVREYIQAADAIGASHARRMFVHILPNVSHVILVQLSLHVVLFIKSEVVLSFLGFGVGVDTVSWGSMLNEAQNELILGYWWQLVAATVAMALLVTGFSLFTDALRDALDPKLK